MSDSDSDEQKVKHARSDDDDDRPAEPPHEMLQERVPENEVVPDVSDSDDGIDDSADRGYVKKLYYV